MHYSPVRHSPPGLPRAAVRLACVKHAASVQSEPGSNSSVQSGIYSNASQIISLNLQQRAYANTSSKSLFQTSQPFQIFVRPELVAGKDLNLRPSGYEPDELPDCSTPRLRLLPFKLSATNSSFLLRCVQSAKTEIMAQLKPFATHPPKTPSLPLFGCLTLKHSTAHSRKQHHPPTQYSQQF